MPCFEKPEYFFQSFRKVFPISERELQYGSPVAEENDNFPQHPKGRKSRHEIDVPLIANISLLIFYLFGKQSFQKLSPILPVLFQSIEHLSMGNRGPFLDTPTGRCG